MHESEDYAASLMNDMDPRLLELIRGQINTFIKWDLVRFFNENPHTNDTAENIARYTGRDVRIVEPELIQLAEDGVLEMEALPDMRVFTYTADQELRALVADFLARCEDRQFRVKAIYHVIRNLR
ncbi:MAG: hypothetical protein K8S97_09660 [Anaerolineae bacterium]|nr:hypothetical protein [Anaerolineae bacterium]